MELFYRGIAHQSTNPNVETVETTHEGSFLGKSYKIRQGKVAHRHNAMQLKYRGTDYNI